MKNKWMPGMLLRPALAREQGDYRVISVDEEYENGVYRIVLHCVQPWRESARRNDLSVDVRKFYPLIQKLDPVNSDFATALCLAELRARTWEPGVSH